MGNGQGLTLFHSAVPLCVFHGSCIFTLQTLGLAGVTRHLCLKVLAGKGVSIFTPKFLIEISPSAMKVAYRKLRVNERALLCSSNIPDINHAQIKLGCQQVARGYTLCEALF